MKNPINGILWLWHPSKYLWHLRLIGWKSNISERSKKDYAGLQELFWCLAKMRCHSISCTSALLTLLCPTSSELPAAQSGSAKAGIQFFFYYFLIILTFLACSLQTGLPTQFSGSWPVPSKRTSLLTQHGAGTWVEGPCRALVSPGLSSDPSSSPTSLLKMPRRGNTLEMFPL